MGSAMKSFENALGINVPRSRFLPVKTTSDLLLVMSNLYSMNAGSLTMSPKREFPSTPHVKLGSSFTKVRHTFTLCILFWLRAAHLDRKAFHTVLNPAVLITAFNPVVVVVA